MIFICWLLMEEYHMMQHDVFAVKLCWGQLWQSLLDQGHTLNFKLIWQVLKFWILSFCSVNCFIQKQVFIKISSTCEWIENIRGAESHVDQWSNAPQFGRRGHLHTVKAVIRVGPFKPKGRFIVGFYAGTQEGVRKGLLRIFRASVRRPIFLTIRQS